jgi:hypothetical protein
MRSFLMAVLAVASSSVLCSGDSGFRSIEVSEASVPQIHCTFRYSTVIEFPQDEEVENVPIGDGAAIAPGAAGNDAGAIPNWIMWPYHHVVSVKPTAKNVRTSMTVVTKDSLGRYYTTSFELAEVTSSSPDIHVVIVRAKPKGVPVADQLASLNKELAGKDEEIAQLKQDAEKSKAEAKPADPPAAPDPPRCSVTKPSVFLVDKKGFLSPFNVEAIWYDGEFTCIRAKTLEPPSLFEFKDDKLSLIEYSYARATDGVGVYTIPKVVEQGALRVGKKQILFREDKKHGTTGK